MNEAYKQGYKLPYIYPITPDVIYELKENIVNSQIPTLNYMGKNVLPCKSITPSYFKLNAGIVSGDVDDDILYEIVVEDEYILDTGCIITNLGNTEYINYNELPNRYNNYPYDKDGNAIKNETLRKDHLCLIEDFIIYEKKVDTITSSGEKISKTEVLFRENTFLFIDRKQKIPIHNATFPNLIILEKKSEIPFIENEIITKWPPKNNNLLGMNVISQIGGKISKSRLGNIKFTFNNPKLIEGRDYYAVYQLQPEFKLYSTDKHKIFTNGKILDSRFTNNENNLFNLCKESLMNDSNEYYNIDEFEIKQNLNLLVLENFSSEIFKTVKNKIFSKTQIDGIIFKNIEVPYSVEIWLKNFSVLKYNKKYGMGQIVKYMDYFEQYLPLEMETINDNILSEWYICSDFKGVIKSV